MTRASSIVLLDLCARRNHDDDDRSHSEFAARANAATRPLIHPAWVRVTHWINALAMLVMIGSGWQIYDAAPLFGFMFPRQIALGNWLAGALLWHFAAMWLLMINGVVYLILGILSGRFRRKLFPIYPGEVFHDLFAALRGKLAHDDLSVYNAVQKLLYLGIIIAGITIVLSGLVDLEAGAVSPFDQLLRRLQYRALCPFRRHDGDCRLPGRACESWRSSCRRACAR